MSYKVIKNEQIKTEPQKSEYSIYWVGKSGKERILVADISDLLKDNLAVAAGMVACLNQDKIRIPIEI